MKKISINDLHERQRGTLPELLGFDIVSATTQSIDAGLDIKPIIWHPMAICMQHPSSCWQIPLVAMDA